MHTNVWVWGKTVGHNPPGLEINMSPPFAGRNTRCLLYGYPTGTEVGGPNFSMLLEYIIDDPTSPKSPIERYWRLYRVGEKLQYLEDYAPLEEALNAAEVVRGLESASQ